jgi:Flp pilus assembly protein TadD
MFRLMTAGVLLLGAATAAQAQDFAGAAQIMRGDLAGAERAIQAEQRLFPRDADLLLNLAYVYARTGRQAEARQLYRQVAAQPDELLDMPAQRTARAHAVAAMGLQRLDRQVAAR